MEVKRSQVYEDVLEVEAVDFCGCNEVGEDEFVGAGIGGLLAVVRVQRLNAGDVGVYEGEREREHGVYVISGADAASTSVKRALVPRLDQPRRG